MAKFYGKLGFVSYEKRRPGVYSEVGIENRFYSGDVIRNARRWENGESINDDLTISNSISIIADPYAYDHLSAIRYVEWMGTKWKVSSFEIQRPRLILQLGGVYNGDED